MCILLVRHILELAELLQRHVAFMDGMMKSGHGVRHMDPAFVQMADNLPDVDVHVKNLTDGVEVHNYVP